MTLIQKLAGLTLSALFDLSLGLFSALFIGKLTNHETNFWEYGLAMALAVLPDFDAVLQKKSQGFVTGEHKSVLHYPLIMLTLAFLLGGVASNGSAFWTALLPTCLLLHYMHDSCERGPGIPWFAPFSYAMYRRPRIRDGTLLCPMVTYEEMEEEKRVTLEDWLKREYLQVTTNLVLGVCAFVLALCLVIASERGMF